MDNAPMFRNVSSEADPSHCIVVRKVGAGVDRVAEEVRAIVAGIGIKSHHVREGMKGC